MAVSSEDINFLVYRYLQESGFVHSAFTFCNESLVLKSSVSVTLAERVPPGALISFVQKGLLYLQVESQVDTEHHNSGSEVKTANEGTALGEPHVWKTLARTQSVQYSKWSLKFDKNRDEENEDERITTSEPNTKRHRQVSEVTSEHPERPPAARSGIKSNRESVDQGRELVDVASLESLQPCRTDGFLMRDHSTRENIPGQVEENSASKQARGNASSCLPQSSCADVPVDQGLREHNGVAAEMLDDTYSLSGHTAEVFCCAWHPQDEILASGSGDSTVRLWDLTNDATARTSPKCTILACSPHIHARSNEDRDVTTLEWSANGRLLATGCMDGVARLWSQDGLLQHTLSAHSESIFSLRFDDFGERILTGSYDKCVAVWDVKTGQLHSKFEAHSAQVLDVDWRHGAKSQGEYPESVHADGSHMELDAFASCSTDSTIAVYSCPCNETAGGSEGFICGANINNAGSAENSPRGQSQNKIRTTEAGRPRHDRQIRILKGHTDEVNAIRWDPSGTLLASCSDDRSIILWRFGLSTPIRRLCEHREEIYTLRWSPTGPGTKNPSAYLRLASASFDASVKIWDADAGACVSTLKKHDKKVYTISFSPSGDLIASGSLGGQVNIWSVHTGALVKTFFAHQQDSVVSSTPGLSSPGSFSPKAVTSSADIFEVAWNSTGTRLAATSTSAVTVIDLKK